MRSGAEIGRRQIGVKHTGSDNECYGQSLNRIQHRSPAPVGSVWFGPVTIPQDYFASRLHATPSPASLVRKIQQLESDISDLARLNDALKAAHAELQQAVRDICREVKRHGGAQ